MKKRIQRPPRRPLDDKQLAVVTGGDGTNNKGLNLSVPIQGNPKV